MKRICLAGRHVRPYMENAARNGWRVAALDGFNDWDARRFGTLVPAPRCGGPEEFFSAVSALPDWPLILCSPAESNPAILKDFSNARQILNAPAQAVAACRDFNFLRRLTGDGIDLPETSFGQGNGEKGWIIKNHRSAGGTGIRPDDDRPLGPREFRQKVVAGDSVGAVYFSSGGRALLAGIARHINHGWLFAGGIYPAAVDGSVYATIERFGQRLSSAAGLKGWWGADFILGEKIYLLEVNPRFTASLELVAGAHGIDVVDTQLRAMDDGCHIPLERPAGYYGRMVCYAEKDCEFTDAQAWFERGARDIPHPGSTIKKGAPVLSLYAQAASAAECKQRLDEQSGCLRRELHGL
ncbi:MAG: ATP-grasp domain-containing protein [Nitrospinae bacterium]|nr:ATP-grasp domain-containing protein [Nitrospinota bacterium]